MNGGPRVYGVALLTSFLRDVDGTVVVDGSKSYHVAGDRLLRRAREARKFAS